MRLAIIDRHTNCLRIRRNRVNNKKIISDKTSQLLTTMLTIISITLLIIIQLKQRRILSLFNSINSNPPIMPIQPKTILQVAATLQATIQAKFLRALKIGLMFLASLVIKRMREALCLKKVRLISSQNHFSKHIQTMSDISIRK